MNKLKTSTTLNLSVIIFLATVIAVGVFLPINHVEADQDPLNVVMFYTPGEDRPFASKSFIYLSQVPYTGISSDFKGILFVILLSIFSAYVAYLIMKRWLGGRVEFAAEEDAVIDNYDRSFNREDKAQSIREIIGEKEIIQNSVLERTEEVGQPHYRIIKDNHLSKEVKFDGSNLPIEDSTKEPTKMEVEEVRSEVAPNFERHAKERGVLISQDALNLLSVVPNAIDNSRKQLDVLNSVISIAGITYPRDDGWIVLDRKRLESVLFSSQYDVVKIFASWLSEGESAKTFAFLRLLRSNKISVKSFLKKVAYYIDNLYRCRIGESLDDNHTILDLENQCTNWSTRDIQKIVGILVNGVDESYESEDASVKLALVKVLEISERSKVEGKSYYEASSL